MRIALTDTSVLGHCSLSAPSHHDLTAGLGGSLTFYVIVLGAAYALSIGLSLYLFDAAHVWFLLATLGWAGYLVRCFRLGVTKELPQKTAQVRSVCRDASAVQSVCAHSACCVASAVVPQFNLMFGFVLIGTLSPPPFFARVLLACLFYLGGVNNIIMWSYNGTSAWVASRADSVR